MTVIALFDNKREYAFLSNFWKAPVVIDDKTWQTTEAYYQSQKTLDEGEREQIRAANTPAQAKSLGRKCTMRPDWDDIKYGIMLKALRAKFSQHEDLKEKLLATGDAFLLEGNRWDDNCWGVCLCDECPGTGTNWLGKALMEVRSELERQFAEAKWEKMLVETFEIDGNVDAFQFALRTGASFEMIEGLCRKLEKEGKIERPKPE